MSNDISIDDLAQPQYSELQRAALDYGESIPVDLSRESILAEACHNTGLSDFGPEDFIQRLDLLVNEWNADSGLSSIGRLSLRNKLLQHVSSRLLIQNQWTRHPEILDIPIEKPIIVVGLPRSGTTHLLNLLAADSRFRSLPLWESYEPVPLAGETIGDDGIDPRYQRCSDSWDMMQQMTPHLAAMHPMNPDHIHEELELMGPNIASYNYEWLSPCPRWRDHYYQNDQTPHYEYMKNVLRLLLWQQSQRSDADALATRWVLKCPQHLEQLPVLKKVFPDATFAVTHRDPIAVIQSSVTMLGYGQRMNRRQVELGDLINYWSDRVEHLLQACCNDRACLPEDQSIDVPFHEFMADDLAMIEKIYNKAGIAMTARSKQQLQHFIDNHPRGKNGRMVYNLQRDFAVDPAQLRQRFDFYFHQFPVKAEI